MDVGHIDDAAARVAQSRCRGLRNEQRPAQIGADQVFPVPQRDFAHRGREEAGSIIDQDVEPTKALNDGLNEPGYCVDLPNVGRHYRRRVCAQGIKFRGQLLCFGARMQAVNGHARSGAVHCARDGCAEPFCTAGDQNAAVLQWVYVGHEVKRRIAPKPYRSRIQLSPPQRPVR